jgi:hypothetical protein
MLADLKGSVKLLADHDPEGTRRILQGVTRTEGGVRWAGESVPRECRPISLALP